MTTRQYIETGPGFRLRAMKRSWHNATYEITPPPKVRMDRHDIDSLQHALSRAQQAMGEEPAQ